MPRSAEMMLAIWAGSVSAVGAALGGTSVVDAASAATTSMIDEAGVATLDADEASGSPGLASSTVRMVRHACAPAARASSFAVAAIAARIDSSKVSMASSYAAFLVNASLVVASGPIH